MDCATLRVLGVLFLIGCCFGQVQNAARPRSKTLCDVDKLLAESRLKDCETRRDQLQQWVDINYPLGQHLQAENQQLRGDLKAEREDGFRSLMALLAVGVG